MWLNVVIILVGLFTAFYFYMTRNFGKFQSKGIKEHRTMFPFGCYQQFKFLTGRLSFINTTEEIYEEHKDEKMLIYFSMDKPNLLVNDLSLAKNIMIKDFDHFIDRRTIPMDENAGSNKYFANMLTMLKGEKWKQMRSTISPVFTSGKLKAMSTLINKVGDDFVNYLDGYAERGEDFNGKEMMTSFTLDAIANCGFGVEANSFKDPDSIFRKMVNVIRKIFCSAEVFQVLLPKVAKLTGAGGSKTFILKLILMIAIPFSAKLFKLQLLDEEGTKFMVDVIKQSMEQRKGQKSKRNDLIDLVIEALNDSSNTEKEVEDDQFEKDAVVRPSLTSAIPESEIEMYLVSNALLLFFAGFDTSSTIMSICLYFLSKNPEVQERLYNEIADAIEDQGHQHLDYNTVQSLPYLDQVIHETLRHYPLTIIERLCVKDYKVPGTDFVVPKGMMVQIPSGGIMKDEKYFPNPNEFDPENFSPENKANMNPYSFLAFGHGPRNCVGMRFALLQVKISIIRLLANYRLLESPKAPEKLVPDPLSQSAQPIGGVWVKVQKREE